MKRKASLWISGIAAATAVATSSFGQGVSCTASNAYKWVPEAGQTYISEDQYGRYVYQYFLWWSTASQEWWKLPYAPGALFSAGTFEQQTVFYNYDGGAYGNAPYGYWDANFSYPYVDTQALDSPNERNITIGSAHAYDFGTNWFYRYVTRFTSGGGSSSMTKVQSQRGLRSPPSCYSTWCSFGCDTADTYVNVVPFSAFTAPGSRCWKHLTYDTSNSPC